MTSLRTSAWEASCPYIHSYFNLSTATATKRVPAAKITSPERPLNQRLTNSIYKIYRKKVMNRPLDPYPASMVSVSVWFLFY